MNETFDTENTNTGIIEPGSWKSGNELSQIQPCHGRQWRRNSTTLAKEIRDKFCDCFNNTGAVEWQDRVIENDI